MSISKQIIFSSSLVAILALLAGYIGYRNISSLGVQMEECHQADVITTNNLIKIQNNLTELNELFVEGETSSVSDRLIADLNQSLRELNNSNISEIGALNQVIAEYQSYSTIAKKQMKIDPAKLEQSRSRGRKILANILQVKNQETRHTVNTINQSISKTSFWISLICVMVFAMAIVFGQIIARALNKSLLSLEHSAAEILKGNFSAKVDIKSNDEFGYLAKSFNHLAEGVQQTKLIELQKNEMLRLNNQLEKKNDSLNSFVYRVSHDLKAPLTNLISLQDIFKNQIKEVASPSALKTMNFMEKNTSKLLDTIHDLLELSRAENNAENNLENVNLSEIVQEVTLENGEAIETSKTSFQLNLEAEFIQFSKTNLKSIFANLITNAIKYRDEKKDNQIFIQSRKLVDEYELVVKDNGLGMDLEKYGDKLFGKFNRFHNHVEGSGVGLYIVKKVIEEYGGNIQVASQIGKGTEFTIHLPFEEIKESNTHKETIKV